MSVLGSSRGKKWSKRAVAVFCGVSVSRLFITRVVGCCE